MSIEHADRAPRPPPRTEAENQSLRQQVWTDVELESVGGEAYVAADRTDREAAASSARDRHSEIVDARGKLERDKLLALRLLIWGVASAMVFAAWRLALTAEISKVDQSISGTVMGFTAGAVATSALKRALVGRLRKAGTRQFTLLLHGRPSNKSSPDHADGHGDVQI